MKHTARLLTIPATVTIFCSFDIHPPRALMPASRPTSIVTGPPVPAAPPKELPRIVAVNQRIAKRVNALRPCVKARLKRVVAKLPKRVTLLVTSAARTRQEQAALRPTFGIKARPGTSTHEDGRAVDLNVLVDGERVSPRKNQKYIGAAMESEGFQYLGRRDPVHYSVPKWEIDKAMVSGPELTVPTWDELKELTAELEAQEEATEVAREAAPAQTAGAVQTAFGVLATAADTATH